MLEYNIVLWTYIKQIMCVKYRIKTVLTVRRNANAVQDSVCL